MKFNELKQAMDWRRRVGFNGGGYVKKKVLPQPKPKEEAEKVNKARKEKTFEKAKPALENPKEVKEMIDKPKRGLVDEPGSYAGKFRTLDDELTSLGKKKGDRFLRYLGIYGDASFYQPELSISDKNTAKNLKGKKQLSDWWKTIPANKRTYIRESFKSYETSVGNNPALRRKLYESLRTDKKFYNQFKKNAATKTITELAGEKGRTEYNKIQKEFDDIVFKKGKTGKVFSKQVTEDGNKILKVMKKDSSLSLARIIEKAKVPAQRVSSALGALFNNTRDAAGKLRFNISNNIQKRLESFSNLNLGGVGEKLVKKGQATKQEVQKLITRPAAVLSKILPKGSVFEHTLPKNVTDKLLDNNLIDKKTYDALYRTGSRTSPFLNDFKAKFDIKQGQLLEKYLQDKNYKSYKKEIDKIRKTISNKTGGYKIGYVDFKDGKMNIVANAKSLGESLKKFGPETTQKYLALDNIKYTKNLLENYNKNPNDEAFSSMLNKRTNIVPGEKVSQNIVNDYKFLEKSYNASKPFLQSTAKAINFAKNNLNNPVTRALFANPFGRKAGIVTAALVAPSALQANETVDTATPVVETESFPTKTTVAAGTGAAAVGTKRGRNILGKAFRTLGTPLSGLGFAATNVASKMKEGQSLADAVVDPITGLELSFPGLFKENLSKIISERAASAPGLKGAAAKFGRGLLGLGRIGRLMTPVGLTLAAAGQAQDFYNQYQNLQRMKRDDPEAYQQFRSTRVAPALSAAEQTAIEDMGRFGAAGGGIMKMAGKSSGPPPESGPTSQGLDFLMKRGRQY